MKIVSVSIFLFETVTSVTLLICLLESAIVCVFTVFVIVTRSDFSIRWALDLVFFRCYVDGSVDCSSRSS